MPNPMFEQAFGTGTPSPTTTTPAGEDNEEEGEEEVHPHKKWRKLPESKHDRGRRQAVAGCRRYQTHWAFPFLARAPHHLGAGPLFLYIDLY